MTNDGLDDFIERFALLAEADGLPRIAGRMLALVLLEGGPFSFQDLVRRLKASKGSISTSTRLLQQMGAIERTSKVGDRQDYFQITASPFARMLESAMERHRKARQIVRDVVSSQSDLSPETRERLGRVDQFYGALLDAEKGAIGLMDTVSPGRRA